MEQKLLDELRARLEQEKTELETELKNLGSEKPGPDVAYKDRGTDEDVNAQEYTEHQDDLSLEASLETTLGEVNAALERMADGTYGTCENCGKAIAEERLKALPRATHCMDCEAELNE